MHELIRSTSTCAAVRASPPRLALLPAVPATARCRAGVEDFYKGKTVNRCLIGFSVGGGYDLYARLLARHWASTFPAHPTVVPQNMTGAGSLRAAQLSSIRPPRRTAPCLGTFARTTGITPLLDSGASSTAPSSPGSAASPTT